jgi:hypothetical protein
MYSLVIGAGYGPTESIMKIVKSTRKAGILHVTLGRREYRQCGAYREAKGPSGGSRTGYEQQAWRDIVQAAHQAMESRGAAGCYIFAPATAKNWTIAELEHEA